MAELEITEALDLGGDVLLVRGRHPDVTAPQVVQGEPRTERRESVDADGARVETMVSTIETTITHAPAVLEARGWVSSLREHYDASDYLPSGDLKPKAKPRPMTPEEAKAYMLGLLAAQNAERLPAASAGRPLDLDAVLGVRASDAKQAPAPPPG